MIKDAVNEPTAATPLPPTTDRAAGRSRLPVLAAAAAAVLEAAALALLLAHPAAAWGAALLHAASVVPLAAARGLGPSERGLLAALAFTLPVVGIPLGLVALATAGRAEIGQQPPDELAEAPELPDPDEARR